jgi:glycosyltransferase involved in cell wall biosynthesis
LVEALAAGLPIVAVDTPQTRDVVAEAARIVRDDPTALAAALRDALAMPRAHGATAAARVVAGYDRATSGDRILELYETLLA